jgi:ribosomal protein S18 acetylase RimI-like enzyme
MNSFPSTFDEAVQPLPSDKLPAEARAAQTKLAGQGYEVYVGLTRDYAQAIMAMAREPAILEYCPNDSGERFANESAVEHWLSKRRGTFLLLKRTETDGLRLAGYGWVGEKSSPHIPDSETTFSLRVGEADQGKGLAAPFARLTLAGSMVLFGARHMWLETWHSNGGAVHIYHKLGFTDCYERPDKRPSHQVGGLVDDVRIYMTLPDVLLRS